MNRLLGDVRYALRGFLKNPLFTIIAITSLALGLGANSAIFNLLDQVLFRPLPVKDAHQLVLLTAPGPGRGSYEGDSFERIFSFPMYQELRERVTFFSDIVARYPTRAHLGYQGQSESVITELVTGNYFDMLGLTPAHGRLFSRNDDVVKGGHPVVVLSHGLWTRRFGGDAAVLGQAVRVNGTLMTVIGVAPRDFFGVVVGAVTDLYVPLMMKAQVTPTWDRLEDRTMHFLHLLARLKPGITAAQAQSALQAIYLPIREADLAAMTGPKSERFLERYSKKQLVVNKAATGVPTFTEGARTPLTLLMVMVGLVLLIACANVANLLVARALGRQKEIAVRLSLGARRIDVVRQLLVESILLALGGAVAGLAVASWTSDFIVAAIPASSAGALNPVLDPRTLWFGLALALITGIGFGLLPAWQATRPQLATALRAQGGGVIGGFRQIRSRQALVVIQVALSLLLLMGAGLFTRSLANLRKLDPGFQTQNLVLFTIDGARAGYPQPRIQQVYESIQERLSSIPGVRAAALADVLPLSGDRSVSAVTVAGYTPKPDENTAPDFAVVSPGYFQSMRIELLAGREFTKQDQPESRRVAVVNQTFARYFFGNQNPIGRTFRVGRQGTHDVEIVGVARDGKYDSLRNETVRFVYLCVRQQKDLSRMQVLVRTAAPPETAIADVRREMGAIDSNLAMWDVKTMESQINETLFAERIVAALCACFGALATLLAAIGLYGVTAFSVARRTREIGIRMALGAARPSVVGMVLKEVAILCVIGLGVGVPVALALGKVVETQLYGVPGRDWLSLTIATVILLAVSLAAGFLPARRAASVDPTIALRYE